VPCFHQLRIEGTEDPDFSGIEGPIISIQVDFYSCRSAACGSIEAARRAGISPAMHFVDGTTDELITDLTQKCMPTC
jgi:hypothetical protein